MMQADLKEYAARPCFFDLLVKIVRTVDPNNQFMYPILSKMALAAATPAFLNQLNKLLSYDDLLVLHTTLRVLSKFPNWEASDEIQAKLGELLLHDSYKIQQATSEALAGLLNAAHPTILKNIAAIAPKLGIYSHTLSSPLAKALNSIRGRGRAEFMTLVNQCLLQSDLSGKRNVLYFIGLIRWMKSYYIPEPSMPNL